MGPRNVLTTKNVAMIKWTLDMQECGLSINLQELKMKVVELTPIRDTPFQNQIPSTNLWYWFKQRHLEMNIRQAEGLKVCRA
jgi:hypothetical protein